MRGVRTPVPTLDRLFPASDMSFRALLRAYPCAPVELLAVVSRRVRLPE